MRDSDVTSQSGIALIPAYNEAGHIAEVIAGAQDHLPVLVVDDGSTDETAERAEDAGAEVLRQQPNQGKGAALRRGFRHALDAGCEFVVTLDADGQHDPAELSTFLDKYDETGADLIIGARNYSEMPPVRRTSNTIGRWAFSWALGEYVPDNQSGYRLITRRLMETVLASETLGFEFEVEMIVDCVRAGYDLAWVPIRTIYAGETSHIKPVEHVVQFFRVVWKTRNVMRGA